MSHPVPGHHYGEESNDSHSPHKDIGGHRKPKLTKGQRSIGKILNSADTNSVRRHGEAPLQHLKRVTKSRTAALKKKKDDTDFSGSSDHDYRDR